MAKTARTTKGLRDVLFNEIEELQTKKGNPTKAMAVARLASQIVNVARVEMDFSKQLTAQNGGQPPEMGSLQLGSG